MFTLGPVCALALFIARSDRLGGVVVTLLALVVLRDKFLLRVHEEDGKGLGVVCCVC